MASPVAPVQPASTPIATAAYPALAQVGHAPGPAPAYRPGYPIDPGPFASLGRRVLAYLLDSLVSGILVLVVVSVLTNTLAGSGSGTGTTVAVLTGWLGVTVLYWWVPVSVSGRTLGKVALGLRIVRADDLSRPPGYRFAAVRCITGGCLGMVPLGSLINLLLASGDSPEHKAIHDRAARTRVVRADWSPSEGGYTYLAQAPISRTSVAIIAVACGVAALLVVSVVAAVVIPVFLSQRAKGVEAQMRNDANGAASALVKSHGTLAFPLAIPEGSVGAIGDASYEASPGDRITITLSPDRRGNFCVRVDNDGAPSPVYLSSATGTVDHTPCDYAGAMTVTK
jgi:uncharacterized RDD family membrane protein YckC